jgi:hypothetical protein
MGFLSSLGKLTQAAVDVAVTPVEMVKDAVDFVEGGPVENTTDRLRKAKENLEDAYDELGN